MTIQTSLPIPIDRDRVMARYTEIRRQSRALFDRIEPSAYFSRPIPLRHPFIFYDGHLPAFAVNILLRKTLGQPGIDPRLDALFARGIDPEDENAVGGESWPSPAAVRRYAVAADEAVTDALGSITGERAMDPNVREAVWCVIEHELMHQETLRYILHRLPCEQKHRPADVAVSVGGVPPKRETVVVPAGVATLGADREALEFGWDNEFPRHVVDVPAFEIDVHDVTNADYLEFVEAGGYDDPRWWNVEGWAWLRSESVRHPLFWERHDGRWFWRAMFDLVPLPLAWPVYVSHAEASAYASFQGKRLPTEAEFHRAAYGTPDGHERAYPWGVAPPDATRGTFDFRSWDPAPVGISPAGRSAWGVHDLVGNGWEWTSTVFDGFPSFRPMAPLYPEYSADFFDGKHFVIKGASPATATELLRKSFRNWFRAQYPYVYATFRGATAGPAR